ncbi:hypothetical protein L210DRAFT_941270 [Boletus edulis BED1]|uniref:Uncharacterized protein n=1 Tax=Boletus edulis BED1 TaxID=1328754 RepID=A0AAD4BQL3_BOLED|nr:hypothetical protein L210DRAFT_941270 [Boletus edulis BED1]
MPRRPIRPALSCVIDHAHHVRVSNLEIQSTLGQHITTIVVQTRTTLPESPPSSSRCPYRTLSQSAMLSEPQKANRHRIGQSRPQREHRVATTARDLSPRPKWACWREGICRLSGEVIVIVMKMGGRSDGVADVRGAGCSTRSEW